MGQPGIIKPTEAYATLEDVLSEIPHRNGKFTAQSQPTASQCEEIIKDLARLVDAKLRALGYSPPLTGSDDKAVLKSIIKPGAAAQIESAALAVRGGDSPLVTRLSERHDTMMKDLSAGKYKFYGAGDPPSQQADGNDDLDTSGDREDSIFQMSTSQRDNQF